MFFKKPLLTGVPDCAEVIKNIFLFLLNDRFLILLILKYLNPKQVVPMSNRVRALLEHYYAINDLFPVGLAELHEAPEVRQLITRNLFLIKALLLATKARSCAQENREWRFP